MPQEYWKNTSHTATAGQEARTRVCFYWPGLVSVCPGHWPLLTSGRGCDWSGHHWPVPAPLPLVSRCPALVSVSSPHSLALTSQTPFTNLNSTSSGRFIVIALPCLLFDKVISMRYPWIKVFKSAHEVPIYDFVARYRLWGDGAASHKENIILWPSNNPTQMWL